MLKQDKFDKENAKPKRPDKLAKLAAKVIKVLQWKRNPCQKRYPKTCYSIGESLILSVK